MKSTDSWTRVVFQKTLFSESHVHKIYKLPLVKSAHLSQIALHFLVLRLSSRKETEKTLEEIQDTSP